MENVKHKHREGKMIVLENGELKIKSTELVDIINDFRKVEAEAIGKTYTELAHYDFYKKIKKELDTLKSVGVSNDGNISEITYLDSKNRIQPCFELNRDGMLQMLNSESALVRYKTIEYINKLENQIKGKARSLTTEETLELQFKFTREVRAEVKELKEDFEDLRDNLPLLGVDCDEITGLIKKVCTNITGYETPAYKDKSLRGRVYQDIYGQVRREFQVNSYKAIKRSQIELAKEIIRSYKAPTALLDEIIKVNNQIDFKEVI